MCTGFRADPVITVCDASHRTPSAPEGHAKRPSRRPHSSVIVFLHALLPPSPFSDAPTSMPSHQLAITLPLCDARDQKALPLLSHPDVQ